MGLVIQYGLLHKLHRGDLVLADRGFIIKDLLNKKPADLNIPPFLSGRSRLTPQEEMETINANARIHAERAMESLEKYTLPWR